MTSLVGALPQRPGRCVGGGGCAPCLQGVPQAGPPLPSLGAPPCQGSEVQSPPQPLTAARPATPPSLCHHWHLLPGLLHRPLQLLVPARAEAAVLQVQVSPPGRPALALLVGVPLCRLSASPLPVLPLRRHSFCEAEGPLQSPRSVWRGAGIWQVPPQGWLGVPGEVGMALSQPSSPNIPFRVRPPGIRVGVGGTR